jgi:hypothetical protein
MVKTVVVICTIVGGLVMAASAVAGNKPQLFGSVEALKAITVQQDLDSRFE